MIIDVSVDHIPLRVSFDPFPLEDEMLISREASIFRCDDIYLFLASISDVSFLPFDPMLLVEARSELMPVTILQKLDELHSIVVKSLPAVVVVLKEVCGNSENSMTMITLVFDVGSVRRR